MGDGDDVGVDLLYTGRDTVGEKATDGEAGGIMTGDGTNARKGVDGDGNGDGNGDGDGDNLVLRMCDRIQ